MKGSATTRDAAQARWQALGVGHAMLNAQLKLVWLRGLNDELYYILNLSALQI